MISCGDGQVTNAIDGDSQPACFQSDRRPANHLSVRHQHAVDEPTGRREHAADGNQYPAADGTQSPRTMAGETNVQITIGMTNQWHFYVVTNTTGLFTNAAFVTFISAHAFHSAHGCVCRHPTNATRPEADIDLYVSTDSGLTNLDPRSLTALPPIICIIGGQSTPGVFATAGQSFKWHR